MCDMRSELISVCLSGALMALLGGCRKAEPPSEPKPPTQSNAPTRSENSAQSNAPPATIPVQSAPAQPTVASPQARVLLKVKWPVGNRYVYRLSLEQHSTNQISSLPQPSQEHLALGLTYAMAVLKETESAGRELELEFLANDMEIRMADKIAVSFDTTDGTTNETRTPVPGPFRKLIGSKLRLQLDADGKVNKVVELREWAKSLVGDGTGPAEQMLVQQFNEGFFQQLADFGRGLLTQPVQVGDCWRYQTEVPAGGMGRITVDSTILFRRWEDREPQRFAVVEARGAIQGAAGGENHPAGHISLDRGTVTSTAWFDPEAGALVESVVEQAMRLTGEVPGPPDGNQPPASFTSDIGQTVTVKLVELHEPK